MKIPFLKMKEFKILKKTSILEFTHRFYAVEISKAIVSLIEQLIKTLLNSDVKIYKMIFETLNRCDFSTRSDSKFHVISVIDDKIKIMRIFIFVIKNDDHDLIFETLCKRKTMLSFKYFVDKSCKTIIHSQCDIKRVKFQTIVFNHKSNKTINFIFAQKFLN